MEHYRLREQERAARKSTHTLVRVIEHLEPVSSDTSFPPELPTAPLTPLKASAPNLRRRQSATAAFEQACSVAAKQVLHNWDVVLHTEHPEGPHQFRVALRRLRCTIKAFQPAFTDPTLRSFQSQARDLSRIVSELRDADVLASEIIDAARLAKDDGEASKLKQVLLLNATAQRKQVREKLSQDEWRAFRLRLVELSQRANGPQVNARWSQKAIATRALTKRWRSVAKAGRNLEHLTVEQRHELRKAVKRLRYTVDLFASLYPKGKILIFVNNLRRMQHQLGYLNDIAAATKLKQVVLNFAVEDDNLQRAADQIMAWHIAQAEAAWRKTRKDWRKLIRTPKLW